MPYQKHCFIIVKTRKNLGFFYLIMHEYSQYIQAKPPVILVLFILIKPRTKLRALNKRSKSALRNSLLVLVITCFREKFGTNLPSSLF